MCPSNLDDTSCSNTSPQLPMKILSHGGGNPEARVFLPRPRALGIFGLFMMIGVVIDAGGAQQTRHRTTTYASASSRPTLNQLAMALAPAVATVRADLYPKEVQISSVDSRFRSWLGGARGRKIAVQLAPGVYSERGSSPDLGTLGGITVRTLACVST